MKTTSMKRLAVALSLTSALFLSACGSTPSAAPNAGGGGEACELGLRGGKDGQLAAPVKNQSLPNLTKRAPPWRDGGTR